MGKLLTHVTRGGLGALQSGWPLLPSGPEAQASFYTSRVWRGQTEGRKRVGHRDWKNKAASGFRDLNKGSRTYSEALIISEKTF